MVKQESVVVINGGIAANGAIMNGNVKPVVNGGCSAATNGSNCKEGKIHIRAAKPEDANNLRALIQELADHQDMPDGPRIGADQIGIDFRQAAMHSVVAIGPAGDMVAYAVYYFQPSTSRRGQIVHLEDLYIRPQYRRLGLGIRLLREVSKNAAAQRLPCLEWCVLRTNYGALNFYNRLPGIEDLTDKKKTNKSICWRWEQDSWAQFMQPRKSQQGQQRKIEVLLDVPGQIGECRAQKLADQWNSLIGEERKQHYKPLNNKAKKQLVDGHLGVIIVHGKQMPAPAEAAGEISWQLEQPVLGMAFFHRKGYSTWQGKFPELDQIYVAEQYRRKGVGTAIMAELCKVAKLMGATKIQWTAPESTDAKSQHVPFFESLNAANLTDVEEWLLYRWHYEQDQQNGQQQEKENLLNRKEEADGRKKNGGC